MANKTIGAGIAIDGEKEFKSAISGINKDLAVLGSEMGKVTAQFGSNAGSMDALKAKSEVYNKQIEEQKKKIETLKQALANSASEFGENDAKTKNWQISLNRAEAELAKTENALKETSAEMDGFGKSADDSSKKFDNLGGVLKGTVVAVAAVAAAAGAAALALGKAVIGAYADYEQLVGGIDTLFKGSSQKVQEYASNAYKTAGMSANEYMELTTSFSASLIQSLGGDTEKAAEYADRAITDMSDNANKMGTDIASIQNAYQGFAKQNFGMLDNLKLGYGGTKEEMGRLLEDAGKIAGVKFDITSYADITEAIHIMQESMGIAGTTALEAEKTISGSISTMNGAWENLLAGFGNSEADIGALVENLVKAFENVVTNITPVIANLTEALPYAFDAVLVALGDVLPILLETVTNLFQQVLGTLLSLLPDLIPVVVDALLTIVDTLIENLPMIIDGAFELIVALGDGLIEALPELVPRIVEVIVGIVDTITKNLPMILWAALSIIVALGEGLIKSMPELLKQVPTILKSLASAFKFSLQIVKNIGADLVEGLWNGVNDKLQWLKDKLSGFTKSVLDSIKKFFGIASPSKEFAKLGTFMAEGLGVGFESKMDTVSKSINKSISVPEIPQQPDVFGMVSNLMSSQPAGGSTTLTINIDGKQVAKQIYDHLQGESKIRGTAFVAGV